MGIHNAATFIHRFTPGIYNRKATIYSVVLDGNLLAHKGITRSALAGADPTDVEPAIAEASLTYTLTLLERLIQHFDGTKPKRIVIYFDGLRHPNKRFRNPTCSTVGINVRVDAEDNSDEDEYERVSYSREALVAAFEASCGYSERFDVVHLGAYQEAEMLMYLKRDRSCPLTILVTLDSDIFPIAYEHVPLVAGEPMARAWAKENARSDLSLNGASQIADHNTYYDDAASRDVADSCALLLCSKNFKLSLVGLDFIGERLNGFSPLGFRTFAALCGNDWLDNALTPTMIRSILSEDAFVHADEQKFLRECRDVFQLLVCFVVLSLRAGSSVRLPLVKVKKSATTSGDEDAVEIINAARNVERYIDYVSGQPLSLKPFARVDCASLARRISRRFVVADARNDLKTAKKLSRAINVAMFGLVHRADLHRESGCLALGLTAAMTIAAVQKTPTHDRPEKRRADTRDDENLDDPSKTFRAVREDAVVFDASGLSVAGAKSLRDLLDDEDA